METQVIVSIIKIIQIIAEFEQKHKENKYFVHQSFHSKSATSAT